jgi:O-antigen/teichoic acid export membrane protein
MLKLVFSYMSFNGIVLLLGIACFPIIPHIIESSEFGKVGLYLAFIAMIQPIIGLSTENLVQIQKVKLSGQEYKYFIKELRTIMLYISVFLVVFVFFISDIFSALESLDDLFLTLMIILAFVRFLTTIKLMEFTIEENASAFGIVKLTTKIFFFLPLLFCYFFEIKISHFEYMYILIFSESIVFLCIFVKDRDMDYFAPCFSFSFLKGILSFGLPILASAIPIWFINEYAKFSLSNESNHLVGVFSYSKQISLVFMQVAVSVGNAMSRRILVVENSKELFRLSMVFFAVMIFLLASFILSAYLFSPYLIDDSYSESIPIIYILSIGVFFQAMSTIPRQILARERKNSYILISSVVSAFIYMCLLECGFITINIVNISWLFVVGMSLFCIINWLFCYRFVK